ncbi:beta-lactamase-like protein [Penicillium argentinense]|uniref:Beta-lactamase-like protein n=1 Tax=Penicillium argentinense TaxID=1131581 RepID=A0A9W9FF24_9EURO|nr:beta-lactamase-like protein [Penicillium argentinense]KAJ5099048.1 beta-lactamase-like protein [Penicillium argentinense]
MAKYPIHIEPSFVDTTDFDNARRGFIGALEPCIIRAADGRTVWNNDEYSFLNAKCPSTANPKLWRQGQLNSIQGLFEVTQGIYQVRGLDLSNMTIVEGKEGVIIIDPLTAVETAAQALSLYRKHRGERKVTGVIYSHSHIDHFGGAQGILPLAKSHDISIIAPEGFMEEALSENLYVGNAMRRRAVYMYGSRLPKAPDGQIGCGLGMGVPTGTSSLVPPDKIINETGEEQIVDGVRIIFQMVPESEAPSEMNFFFPDHRTLYIAECATHSLHNIITLRGAQVRDAKAWSHYLDESLVLFGTNTDALCAGHAWPTWGREEVSTILQDQRDLYAYLHDQTIRMMNNGMTGIEIAEVLTLPPSLQSKWYTQGFYGSISHNVKGIYQRYVGWFDGNPAHLWEHPPKENAERYVACMGGIDEVVRKAEEFAEKGDLRFAATLLGHAVAFDPTHSKGKMALATVFTKLGHGSENGTWRNFYLTGAQALLARNIPPPSQALVNGLKPTQTVDQWLTLLSIRIDGLKAGDSSFIIDIHVVDEAKLYRVNVSNGALTYRVVRDTQGLDGIPGLTLELKKDELLGVLKGEKELENVQGDWCLIPILLSFLESAGSNTPIRVQL